MWSVVCGPVVLWSVVLIWFGSFLFGQGFAGPASVRPSIVPSLKP
jgi:hypothetical protein